MKKLLSLIMITSITGQLTAEYAKYELKKPERRRNYTYFADDESAAVRLSDLDLRKIEAILKPHVWSDQDYNKYITSSFIKRVIDGCQCGADAQMIEKVLSDFKGKSIQYLYSALGLRREI